jgi:hypothetical protein
MTVFRLQGGPSAAFYDSRKIAMKCFDENQSTQKIAQLNDALRTSFTGGRLMVTAGVSALPPSTQVDVLCAVQAFNTFTPDNDPYGEHDFGRVEVGDCLVFWKIDYYDETLRYSSEDPADPALTVRVLTIMLTEEY